MSQIRPNKKLAREWAKKLKDSGFVDIEETDGRLKKWESHFFTHRPDKVFQDAKAEYYRMAGHFLHDHLFVDEEEKLIWTLHADGKGQRQIIKEMQRRGYVAHFNKVGSIVRRLSAEMKKSHQEGIENE